MMLKEKIELPHCVEIAKDVEHRIKTTGISGLDVEKAKESGFFLRISHLLSLIYAANQAAYLVFGEIDYLLSSIGGKRHAIAKTLNRFEKEVDRLVFFFSEYYANNDAKKDMMMDSENLYRNLMKWAYLPESWQLGDEQRIQLDENDLSIRIKEGEDEYRFYKSVMDERNVEDPKESWCVTKYDLTTKEQFTIHTDMDKASAFMVAKRLSKEDNGNIYTASIVRDIVESRTEVTPFKAFRNGVTIGKLTTLIK